MISPSNAMQAAHLLLNDQQLSNRTLLLDFNGYCLRLLSNAPQILQELAEYFRPFVRQSSHSSIRDLIIIESQSFPFELDWSDWSREAGKSNRKDACADLLDARVIKKVRTGMMFLQSATHLIASGPSLANLNQVINFINNQFMIWLQHHNWLICHASAVAKGQVSVAFAGFSGGGKSTTMLHLMNAADCSYVTNDRLFIRVNDEGVEAQGIPKLPRVNPGTLMHNPRLHNILPEQEHARLENMPVEELWQLEQKYDVDIEDTYGRPQQLAKTQLRHLVILNWQRDADTATTIQPVKEQRLIDLLPAIMKSAGPFYYSPEGEFFKDRTPLSVEQYQAVLQHVTLWEVSGKVDFDCVVNHCLSLWGTAEMDKK
ncbi:MAG: HprK-related kinase B [Aestuariibacter sp.]